MSLPRVLVTHPRHRLQAYYGDEALARLRAFADVRLHTMERDLAGAALVEAARDCDLVVAYRQTPFDAATFAALPGLRAVLRCAVDIRTIDVAAASRHGVLVTQASPGFMTAVAEWIVGVMVDLARGITEAGCAYRGGQAPQPRMGRELRGSTLGIVGFGRIARQLVPIAQALGLHVRAHDPHAGVDLPGVEPCDLGVLLGQSDFVVCLAPAEPATERLFNAGRFSAMRPGSYFINAARGDLVDDQALLEALDRGHLAGAAVDVGRAADQMPSPDVARHPRVIATPHIGGLTPPAIAHQALETVAQARAIVEGRVPAGAVNAIQAYRLPALAAAARIDPGAAPV